MLYKKDIYTKCTDNVKPMKKKNQNEPK